MSTPPIRFNYGWNVSILFGAMQPQLPEELLVKLDSLTPIRVVKYPKYEERLYNVGRDLWISLADLKNKESDPSIKLLKAFQKDNQ